MIYFSGVRNTKLVSHHNYPQNLQKIPGGNNRFISSNDKHRNQLPETLLEV